MVALLEWDSKISQTAASGEYDSISPRRRAVPAVTGSFPAALAGGFEAVSREELDNSFRKSLSSDFADVIDEALTAIRLPPYHLVLRLQSFDFLKTQGSTSFASSLITSPSVVVTSKENDLNKERHLFGILLMR